MYILRTVCLWIVTIFGMLLSYLFVVVLFPILKALYTPSQILSLWAKSILYTCDVNLICLKGNEESYAKSILVSLFLIMKACWISLFYKQTLPDHIRLIWIAKESLFSIPVLGGIMKAANFIPVDRSSGMQAYKSIYKASQKMKTRKSALIIFPEGTRSLESGKMRPFKSGAFLLALRAKLPIQAITIQGTGNIIPIQKGKWIQRLYPGNVNVTIHPCLYPHEYSHKSTQELSDLIRQTIASVMLPRKEYRKNMKESMKENIQKNKAIELIRPRSSGDRAVVS